MAPQQLKTITMCTYVTYINNTKWIPVLNFYTKILTTVADLVDSQFLGPLKKQGGGGEGSGAQNT
jgi:hypothetical protein